MGEVNVGDSPTPSQGEHEDEDETIRFRICKAISEREMTTDEVMAKLGREHQSLSPRMTELKKDGLLDLTGERRLTRLGGYADVLRWKPSEPPTMENVRRKKKKAEASDKPTRRLLHVSFSRLVLRHLESARGVRARDEVIEESLWQWLQRQETETGNGKEQSQPTPSKVRAASPSLPAILLTAGKTSFLGNPMAADVVPEVGVSLPLPQDTKAANRLLNQYIKNQKADRFADIQAARTGQSVTVSVTIEQQSDHHNDGGTTPITTKEKPSV